MLWSGTPLLFPTSTCPLRVLVKWLTWLPGERLIYTEMLPDLITLSLWLLNQVEFSVIIPCHSCTNIGFQDPINHKGSPRTPQDQPKNQCMHPEFQLPLHYSMLHVIFLLLSLQYYVLFVFFLCVCFFGHVYLMINKLINYKKNIYTYNRLDV